MIKAEIGWCWNRYFIYSLETGEALLFSSPSYGGDGSWQLFSNYSAALEAAGMGDVVRDKGTTCFDESFIEQVRSASGDKLIPKPGDAYYREKGYVGQEEHLAEIRGLMEMGHA